MDISTLKKGSKEYYSAKKALFKLLFNLEKEPVLYSQCCSDDPTQREDGLEGCLGSMLADAQEKLDAGNAVVLQLFGRRTMDGNCMGAHGTLFMTDIVTVYVPGQKIDREYIKKVTMGQELFDTTPR